MNLTGTITKHLKTEANLEGLLRQEKTAYTECIKIDRRKIYSLLEQEIVDSEANLAKTEKHVEKVNDKIMQATVKH